ncbi:nitroreductase family protein [candidate division KSB1 bacterium]|nr:nitroreductase family protein [candidate division KSB1 bacterium]
MEFKNLVLKNRSVRRFYQEIPVDRETLKQLVDLARLSASGSNLQPLKYVLVCNPEKNAQVFPLLAWAGYLKEWSGPVEGERPSAYIVILGDKNIRQSFGCDHGIAAQSIMLGATEKGLGGCIIASVKREKLKQLAGLPDHYEILLVIALGKPKEKVQLESVGPDGNIEYYRSDNGIHHVPKRSIEDIIVNWE